jgi:hypothetical protein
MVGRQFSQVFDLTKFFAANTELLTQNKREGKHLAKPFLRKKTGNCR